MSIESPKFEGSESKNVESPEDLISQVRDFDELYEVLDKVCPIQGSNENYTTSELVDIIELIRLGGSVNRLTQTHGLRDKVESLIRSEGGESEDVESPENLISQTENFYELYEVLDKVCPIDGSQEDYYKDELIAVIEWVRLNGLTTLVTRTHGLRDKVESLLRESKTQVEELPAE